MEAVQEVQAALEAYEQGGQDGHRLQLAIHALRNAVPSAFDANNEKKSGPLEREAFELHEQCAAVLNVISVPRPAGSKKRPSDTAAVTSPAKKARVSSGAAAPATEDAAMLDQAPDAMDIDQSIEGILHSMLLGTEG